MKNRKYARISKRISRLTVVITAFTSLVATGFLSEACATAPAPHKTIVRLDGQPLATSLAPVTRHHRTLVPLRDIFTALGATVSYDPLTRRIRVLRGASQIDLRIGEPVAVVNGQVMSLEQPPLLWRQNTMLPLRFLTETFGARVQWKPSLHLVDIRTSGTRLQPGGTAVAGYRTIAVPAGAVVPVMLDKALALSQEPVGTRFTATIRTQAAGDSEFPANSKMEGFISQADPMGNDGLGVFNLDFRTVILPDGSRYAIIGQLAAPLGVMNGALPAGTPLNVVLSQGVAYTDTAGYYDQRTEFFRR